METEYPCVENGPEVYLQSNFPTKNCQVGFDKEKIKQDNAEINQYEKQTVKISQKEVLLLIKLCLDKSFFVFFFFLNNVIQLLCCG